jgi:hypothetical protein
MGQQRLREREEPRADLQIFLLYLMLYRKHSRHFQKELSVEYLRLSSTPLNVQFREIQIYENCIVPY